MRNRTITIPVLAILFSIGCLGCTCPVGQPTEEADAAARPAAVDVPGMKNARKYEDLLFGGQPSAEALEQLAKEGYKTVLSTRGEGEIDWDEKAKVESLGMKFVQVPMGQPLTEITNEHYTKFDEAMKSSERPMVLHCGSGNRVAGLWGVWLVERKQLKAEDALRLAEQAGMTKVRPLVEERLGVTPVEK